MDGSRAAVITYWRQAYLLLFTEIARPGREQTGSVDGVRDYPECRQITPNQLAILSIRRPEKSNSGAGESSAEVASIIRSASSGERGLAR